MKWIITRLQHGRPAYRNESGRLTHERDKAKLFDSPNTAYQAAHEGDTVIDNWRPHDPSAMKVTA